MRHPGSQRQNSPNVPSCGQRNDCLWTIMKGLALVEKRVLQLQFPLNTSFQFHHASDSWSPSPQVISPCRCEPADTCREVKTCVIKNGNLGGGELFKALELAEDPNSIPNTYTMGYNHPQLQFNGIQCSLLTKHVHDTHMMHAYIRTYIHTHMYICR